ncbi:MAG TPA: ribosome-binding factor A [Acidimicrobiales bacterium]
MVRGRRSHDKSPSPYPRTARVNQVLREVVADALERLSDIDDRLRLITVTSIDTAPDLRQATVYLSSLSDEAAEALADERVNLQRQIGRQVRLKRTPLLVFKADPAVAHGLHVEEVLRRLHDTHMRDDGPGDQGPDAGPGDEGPGDEGPGDHVG